MTLIALHRLLALLTVASFVARGTLMLADSPQLKRTWIRVAPHVIDTLLLVTGMTLAIRLWQFPETHWWLTVKIIALSAYIALGVVALRLGKTKMQRVLAWLAALAAFGYIYAVAVTRNPLPFLVLFD